MEEVVHSDQQEDPTPGPDSRVETQGLIRRLVSKRRYRTRGSWIKDETKTKIVQKDNSWRGERSTVRTLRRCRGSTDTESPGSAVESKGQSPTTDGRTLEYQKRTFGSTFDDGRGWDSTDGEILWRNREEDQLTGRQSSQVEVWHETRLNKRK